MSSRGGGATRTGGATLATNMSRSVPTSQPHWQPSTSVSEEAQSLLHVTFGHALSETTIRHMAGAPDDAHVLVSVRHGDAVHWDIRGPYLGHPGGDNTSGSAYWLAVSLSRDVTNGQLGLGIGDFMVHDSLTRQGLASAMIARAATTLSSLGVRTMGLFAARSGDPVHGLRQNGYYTWPMLGFNAPLDQAMSQIKSTPTIGSREAHGDNARYKPYPSSRTPQELGVTPLPAAQKAHLISMGRGPGGIIGRATGHGAREATIRDLLATVAGRKWWLYHGHAGAMTFDNTRGSASRQVLAAYLRSRRGSRRALNTQPVYE